MYLSMVLKKNNFYCSTTVHTAILTDSLIMPFLLRSWKVWLISFSDTRRIMLFFFLGEYLGLRTQSWSYYHQVPPKRQYGVLTWKLLKSLLSIQWPTLPSQRFGWDIALTWQSWDLWQIFVPYVKRTASWSFVYPTSQRERNPLWVKKCNIISINKCVYMYNCVHVGVSSGHQAPQYCQWGKGVP